MRALLLQRQTLYCCIVHFRVLWHAVYMEMHADVLHIHKQTQTHTCTLYCSETLLKSKRQKFTQIRTHIPANKGPTVCGGEMNWLHCIIRMSHQTVINGNRMKDLSEEKNAGIKGGSKK